MNQFSTLVLVATVGLGAMTGCTTTHEPDRAASAAPQRAANGADPDANKPAAAPGPDAQSPEQHDGPQVAVPVTTSVVRSSAVPITVTAPGTVGGGANSQAALAFPEPGRIARIDVAVGQRVASGETIARLDARPFVADAAQMRAALAAAQANYAKTAAGARPQLVAQTKAQMQSARAQLAAAQSNLARQRQLVRLGIAAQVDVETAKTTVATAQSQVQVYEQQQSAQVQPFAPDVAAARAGVAQAQAALAAAQQKIDDATLSAPFSGIVVARLHNDGESVDPTMPVVQIAKERDVVFTAEFAPEDALRIHDGDRATIKAQGTNDAAYGVVIALDPQQTSVGRTIPVLIRLMRGGLAFGPGAYGTASIVIGSQRGLVVPSSAIVSDPTTGTTQVFRKSGDHYAPVLVDIKQDVGPITAVGSSDLHAGDVIVARGAYELIAPASAPKDPDMK